MKKYVQVYYKYTNILQQPVGLRLAMSSPTFVVVRNTHDMQLSLIHILIIIIIILINYISLFIIELLIMFNYYYVT